MYNRIRRWVSSRSFRFRLMAASVICILIPTSITLTMYNYLTQDAVKEQAIANSQQSLLLVNNSVSNTLKYMLNIANSIQMDSDLNSIMKRNVFGEPYTGPNAEYEEFTDRNKILKQIDNITIGGEKSYVTILLSNGTYYSSYSLNDYNPVCMVNEPWFGELKNLYGFNSYWVGAAPTVFESLKGNNPYQLSVVRTLRGEGAIIFGYVIVTIMESQMNQNFQRLAANREFKIVDASNIILSDNDVNEIGRSFPVPLNEFPKTMSSSIVSVGGDDHLLTQATLFNGWKVVSLTPYKQAVSKINSIFSNVILFQIVSFIAFLLLLLYLLRTFTKPLVRLGNVAMKVQGGNLEVRSHIRGEDEIGRLGLLFDLMLDRIKEMIAEISTTQARKRKAELDRLQAQINPHFLFNVLNSIRMKVMFRGDKESAEMIGSLSKLLRMTINQDKGVIPLHEEIDIVMDYTKLMNMRQKQEVQLITDISSDALLERVPRFFLQPLIENALIHGLSQSAGKIAVEARMEGHMLIVAVEDNGAGMDEPTLNRLRRELEQESAPERTVAPDERESRSGFSSLGLANVKERMRMTHGDAFVMHIDSEQGKGTRITMFIPRLEVTASDV